MHPLVGLAVIGALGFVATKTAESAHKGPAINPNTGLVVFGRFTDQDIAAGDVVQAMAKDGRALVLTITGAKSASFGPVFVGVTAGGGGGQGALVQSKDIAAIAPAGTSPTATSGWATSAADLPPVFQAFGNVQLSEIALHGLVRLQDMRGAGTAIVAIVTDVDPTTGHLTAAPQSFQGAVLPPISVHFSPSNVLYIAEDAGGTPIGSPPGVLPPGSMTTWPTSSAPNAPTIAIAAWPLSNPVFQGSQAGFEAKDLVLGDLVKLTALDGTAYVVAVQGQSLGGALGTVVGVGDGSYTIKPWSILFDPTEVQGVATGDHATVFYPTPAALAAAGGAATTSARA
jgi:hypothetical protein